MCAVPVPTWTLNRASRRPRLGIEHDGGLGIHRRIQRRQECQRRRRTRDHAWRHRRQPRPQMGLARTGGQRRRQRQMRLLFAEQQFQFGGAVHAACAPARQIDLRVRRPPGDAELPIHHRDMRVVDAHARGAVRTAHSRCVRGRCRRVAPARPAGRRAASPGPSALIAAARSLARLPRSRLSVPSAARYSVSCGSSTVTARSTTRPNSSSIERQRHLGARDVHSPAARLVGHRDVGQRADRAADRPRGGSPPRPARRADRQPRRAAIGIGRCLQPPGEPRQIDRPLRQPPGDRRDRPTLPSTASVIASVASRCSSMAQPSAA